MLAPRPALTIRREDDRLAATTTGNAIAVPAEERLAPAEVSRVAVTWHRFSRHRTGLIAIMVLLFLITSAIVVPVISPFDPEYSSIAQLNSPAGTVDEATGHLHILGTDSIGKDFFVRLFYASRTSLLVVFVATICIVALGAALGALAGYYGGWVDNVLMRLTDFMLSLPLIPLYIFSIRFIRTSAQDYIGSVGSIALLFILFNWMGISRLVRGSILSLRGQSFIEAATALGASPRQIIFKHLLPNSFPPVLVAATFVAGDLIIWESILAYFGQGISEPPSVSWGNLLAGAQDQIWYFTNLNPFQEIRGYFIIMPALLIMATVLSINYIGDALRDALDPHRAT